MRRRDFLSEMILLEMRARIRIRSFYIRWIDAIVLHWNKIDWPERVSVSSTETDTRHECQPTHNKHIEWTRITLLVAHTAYGSHSNNEGSDNERAIWRVRLRDFLYYCVLSILSSQETEDVLATHTSDRSKIATSIAPNPNRSTNWRACIECYPAFDAIQICTAHKPELITKIIRMQWAEKTSIYRLCGRVVNMLRGRIR